MYPAGMINMIKTIPTKEPGTILRSDRKRWTYADLQRMPETQEHLEIIDGVLYMAPSPHANRHQITVGNLFRALADYADETGAGRVYVSPVDVVASPERVVQPDVFFMLKERLHLVDAYVDGPVDLAVEVLSPSSLDHDRVTKFDLYEETGVKEYWIVDPETKEVEVYILREGAFEEVGPFRVGDTLRSELLEGFQIEADTLFA